MDTKTYINDGIVKVANGSPSGGVSDYGEKGIGQGDDYNAPSHPTPSIDGSINAWNPEVK